MAIKSLEDILGKKLFDRINKKLVLNENGRFFSRMVEPLVYGLKESEILFKDQNLCGDIKIGASTSIANYILPQIMFAFIEKYKGVTIEKISSNTKEVLRLIKKGEVDIGFVEGEFQTPGIQKEVLGTDELYLVTGDEALVQDHAYAMEDLLSKRWILREKGSGTREIFFSHIGNLQKRLNIAFELDHTEGIKSVLSNRNTISCLSRVSVENELASSRLFRLEVDGYRFARSFYTIWNKDKYLSSVLQEFIYFTKHEYTSRYM